MNAVVRAFCVGQAKSGTASLAGLLGTGYRAAHEPERPETLAMILREGRGEVSPAEMASWLVQRDRRLALDFDIAWANQFLVRHLVRVFPAARFVVLVREPGSWLQSVAGHLVSRQIPAEVRGFLDWWFRPEAYPHTEADRPLADRGLYSVRAFLAAWERHVTTCLDEIPASRRLVLRTDELGSSTGRLARFLEIPETGLDVSRGHRNRGTSELRVDSLVSPAYIRESIGELCSYHAERLFPGR